MSNGLHHMLVHFPLAFWSLSALLMLAAARGAPNWVYHSLPPLLFLGFVTGLAVTITGLLAWPMEALLASPPGRNKLAFALWSLAWWGLVWWLHHNFGRALYQQGRAWLMPVLGGVGLILILVTGSLAAILAGVSSPLQAPLRALGFEPHTTIQQPWWALLILVGLVGFLGWMGTSRPSR